MSGARNDLDPAQQVASELRARLRAMGADELVDLCAQLLTTYVVEGVLPLARAAGSADLAADGSGEESFAQMLKRLKAARTDPVLERFIIDGENISVRIDGQGILPVTGYRRPVGPPRAAGVPAQEAPARRESVAGGGGSIYNRSLVQPDQPAPALAPQPPPQPRPAAPAQQQPAAPGQKKADEHKNDRFSLIELE